MSKISFLHISDQVPSISDEYNPKRHFIRARPEGGFYENLACIVLMIGPALVIMKKSLTTRESRYIELIFLLKINKMYVLSRVVRDFFMISSSDPMINTMHTRFS